MVSSCPQSGAVAFPCEVVLPIARTLNKSLPFQKSAILGLSPSLWHRLTSPDTAEWPSLSSFVPDIYSSR